VSTAAARWNSSAKEISHDRVPNGTGMSRCSGVIDLWWLCKF